MSSTLPKRKAVAVAQTDRDYQPAHASSPELQTNDFTQTFTPADADEAAAKPHAPTTKAPESAPQSPTDLVPEPSSESLAYHDDTQAVSNTASTLDNNRIDRQSQVHQEVVTPELAAALQGLGPVPEEISGTDGDSDSFSDNDSNIEPQVAESKKVLASGSPTLTRINTASSSGLKLKQQQQQQQLSPGAYSDSQYSPALSQKGRADSQWSLPSLPSLPTPNLARAESYTSSVPSPTQNRASSVYNVQPKNLDPRASSVYRPPGLVRIDSDVLPSADKSTSDRLLTVVADTVDVPKESIDAIDSFRDLGGNEKDASAVSEECKAQGIDVAADDILKCPTLAELETHAKPCTPAAAPSPLALPVLASPPAVPDTVPEVPAEQERFSQGSRELSSNGEDDAVFTDLEVQGRPSDSGDGYSSGGLPSRTVSNDSKIAEADANALPQVVVGSSGSSGETPTPNDLQHLLMSTSKVAKACLVAPRAGPFEGQLVAFVTTSAMSLSESLEISLPPDSRREECRKEIQMLKLTVQEWGSEHRQPDIWIPLQTMALSEDGKPDERRLRTFIQNINEDAEAEIMNWQLIAPRAKPRNLKLKMRSSEHMATWWRNSSENDAGSPRKRLSPISDTTKDIEFFPLAPMQQLYFRTSMNRGNETKTLANPAMRFSQSILLQAKTDVKLPDIEAAVEALVARHSMLRARFRLTSDGWAQIIMPQTASAYRFGQHNVDDDEALAKVVERSQASIDVSKGPVFAAEYIRMGHGRQLIYLVAHHLVVDLKSWGVITHDLDELVQKGTLLNDHSTPFPDWIEYQNYETAQRLVEPVLPFELVPADPSYWQLDGASNLYGDTERLSFTLTPDLTSVLQSTCNGILRTETSDLFLAALFLSFAQTFTDRAAPTMWQQESGRGTNNREFSIEETVGWFTTLCPIQLPVDATTDLIHLLKLVKDTRKSIPRQGIPFFTSEFSASKSPFTAIPVEVMFNCVDNLQTLERKDGVFQPFPLPNRDFSSLASDVGGAVGRIALFEVSVVMDNSGARVEALYNRNAHQSARIHHWMHNFEHTVLEAIGRLRAMDAGLTLSDAPLLKTSYDGLLKLNSDRLPKLGIDSADAIETIFPVSPAQQEILVAQGLDIDTFHVRSIYELSTPNGSPVDQARLCEAWGQLVAANAMLRSVFMDSISSNGLFDQIVLKKTSPLMLFLDAETPEETLASLPVLRTEPAQPRHRLSVCRTPEKTFIRIDASQAICDSSSIHNLALQLSQAYAGQELSVNNAILPTYLYHVSSLDTSYNLEVWKVNLADASPCHFPRLATEPQEQLQSRSFRLDISRREVADFCRQRKIDPSTFVQLGWALVLRAFVGMARVTFGYQYHGRDEVLLDGISKSIGSYAATLPCSVDLSSSHTLQQCLQTLGEQAASAQQLHALTSPELQHAMGIAGLDLFNTCLSFHDPKSKLQSASELANGCTHNLITSVRTSDNDLCISTMFINDQLQVNASFRYLSGAQAHNTISTFERAMRVILEDSKQTVSDIELFTDRDYAQVVMKDFESSQTEKVSECVHSLVLQHAKRRPDAPAICSWDGDLTYSQMDTYVTRLSEYLVNLGVRPGVTVPIILEKNRWAAVIMLAVLKAGGSFISLDCQDIITTESTIRQLNARIILCADFSYKDVNAMAPHAVLINDRFFSTLPPQLTALVEEASPEHAACVFFSPTKGKTTSSRSIFFTHASLCSAFMVQGPALKLKEDSRVLQISAFNMDIVLVEILSTLAHGGCVCVPSAGQRMHDAAGAISKMSVTWAYMTAVLARRIQPASVPSLKTLCFRTRSLDEDTWRPWAAAGRDVLLAYGAPDVCPLGISVAEVSKTKESSIIPPPLLGHFWILNPESPQKLMPVGAVGELGIDSPVLTPHRYVPGDPLLAPEGSGAPGMHARYLKTGHRVRYLENGNIQFISSMRDDVVMAGSNVQITDVEQHIRRCVGKGFDVLVDAVTTNDSIQVLAAFIEFGDRFVGPEELENLSADMRERCFKARKIVENTLTSSKSLSKKVPPQHIPPVFLPVKRFPVSASLKINRRKLQRLATSMSYAQLIRVSTVPNPAQVAQRLLPNKPLPTTKTEENMREKWAQVLDLPVVDIQTNDTFIGLGGNRVLAMRVVVACREAGMDVSLWDVINGLSLTELCQRTETTLPRPNESLSRHTSERSSTQPAKLAGVDTKFIKDVVAPQLNVHWADVLDVAGTSSNQIRALELGLFGNNADMRWLVINFNGPVRHQRLEVACETLTRLHPVLRTGFAVHDRRVYQVLLDSFKPRFQRQQCPAAHLDSAAEHAVQQDKAQQLKLNEPATKFTFFDAEDQAKLVIRLSTALVDDGAVSLLVEDLGGLYEDMRSVPQKPTFFDYMRAAQVVNYKGSVDYWKGQLRGASMTQIVKHPKPYAPVTSLTKLQETVKVNPLVHYGISFDTVLKAAWAIVLSTVSGSSDVLFGEVVQGLNVKMPESVDVSSVAGPTSNVSPVRVGFPSSHSTPLDLMQYVHGQRACSRPYEALGILDVVHRCTNWSYWTRFSTVVEHRSQPPADGSTTLNMGSTTFTYEVVNSSAAHDMPDVLVSSTMDGPRNTDIVLSFSEARVPRPFAKELMNLLISSIDMLTNYDTIAKPMIQSSVEIARQGARIPLPGPSAERNDRGGDQGGLTLPNDQRTALQSVIDSAWTRVLDPIQLGVPSSQVHRASFYDLWGSLLPAYFFAEHLNKELPKLKVPGIERVRVSPHDMIENPSMQAQYQLVTRKMRDQGITPAAPTLSHRISLSQSSIPLVRSSSTWQPSHGHHRDSSVPGSGGSGSGGGGLTWKRSLKLRNHESLSGIKPRWLKHRAGASVDSAIPENPRGSSGAGAGDVGEGPSASLPLRRSAEDASGDMPKKNAVSGLGPAPGRVQAKPQQQLGTFDGFAMKYDGSSSGGGGGGGNSSGVGGEPIEPPSTNAYGKIIPENQTVINAYHNIIADNSNGGEVSPLSSGALSEQFVTSPTQPQPRPSHGSSGSGSGRGSLMAPGVAQADLRASTVSPLRLDGGHYQQQGPSSNWDGKSVLDV